MPSENTNPRTQSHPPSPPPVNDDNSYHVNIHPSQIPGIRSPRGSDLSPMLPFGGSPQVQSANRDEDDDNPSVQSAVMMDIARNRNVRVSAVGPGWIIGTGLGMMRLLSKISGRTVSIGLARGGMSGSQPQRDP